jgi:heat shock protein HtpX
VQRAIPREYVADRGSAFLTGSPEQLMSALQKLGDAHARIPARDLRAVRRLNALCVVSTSRKPGFLSRDHPPIEKRIAALAEIARELSSRAV